MAKYTQFEKSLKMFILDVGEFILIGVCKKIGESYKLPPCLTNQDLEHDET